MSRRIKEVLSHVGRNPHLLTPIAQLVAVRLSQVMSSSHPSEAEVKAVSVQIANVLGMVAFGEVFTGITGGLALATDETNELDINAVQTIGALSAAGISVSLEGLMFSPGAKMKEFGPWLIGVSFVVASLLKEFAFRKVQDGQREDRDQNALLAKFIKLATSRGGTVLMVILPLYVSNLVVTNSDVFQNQTDTINTIIWLSAVWLTSISSMLVGFQHLTLEVVNAMRLTLLCGGTSSLLLTTSLSGNDNATLQSVAQTLALLFAFGNMLSAQCINAFAENSDDIGLNDSFLRVVGGFCKIIYILSRVARFVGPQLAVGTQALTSRGSESTLALNTAQGLTLLAMLQNLWEAAVGYRRMRESIIPEVALFAAQLVLFGGGMLDIVGDIGGYDLRPTLLMFAAVFHATSLSHDFTNYLGHEATTTVTANGNGSRIEELEAPLNGAAQNHPAPIESSVSAGLWSTPYGQAVVGTVVPTQVVALDH